MAKKSFNMKKFIRVQLNEAYDFEHVKASDIIAALQKEGIKDFNVATLNSSLSAVKGEFRAVGSGGDSKSSAVKKSAKRRSRKAADASAQTSSGKRTAKLSSGAESSNGSPKKRVKRSSSARSATAQSATAQKSAAAADSNGSAAAGISYTSKDIVRAKRFLQPFAGREDAAKKLIDLLTAADV